MTVRILRRKWHPMLLTLKLSWKSHLDCQGKSLRAPGLVDAHHYPIVTMIMHDCKTYHRLSQSNDIAQNRKPLVLEFITWHCMCDGICCAKINMKLRLLFHLSSKTAIEAHLGK